jgi:hypothetical protein
MTSGAWGKSAFSKKNLLPSFARKGKVQEQFCSALQKAQRVDKARQRGAERCRISKELAKHLLTIILQLKLRPKWLAMC